MSKSTTIACMLERHVELNGKCRGCGKDMQTDNEPDDRILPTSRAWLESLGMDYEEETDMLTWQSDDATFAIQVWLFESGPEWFICGESLGEQSPNTKQRVLQLFSALGISVPKWKLIEATKPDISQNQAVKSKSTGRRIDVQLTEAASDGLNKMTESTGLSVGEIFRQSLSLFWKNHQEANKEE